MDDRADDLIPIGAVAPTLAHLYGITVPTPTLKHLFWRGKMPVELVMVKRGAGDCRMVRERDLPAIAWFFIGRYIAPGRAQRVASALDLPLAA